MARKKPIPRSARKALNRGRVRSRGTDEVKNVCNVVWTTEVKDAWKAKLIADRSSE